MSAPPVISSEIDWHRLSPTWQAIFRKNLVFQTELVTEQASQSKFAARYYDMDTYWDVFFPSRALEGPVTSDELARIRGLKRLKCGGTQIGSLSPIVKLGLADLEYLDLNHTNVDDLSDLHALSNLRCVELEYTGVSDLRPLRTSPGLRQLYFSRTPVVDIAALADLGCLVNVDFNDTAVSDVAPLAALSTLETLVINGCGHVRDISALAKTHALKKLDISRTAVSDLAPLAEQRNLQILVAGELAIESIDVLGQLPVLESIYLNNARGTLDLAPLRTATRLRALYIGGTAVTNPKTLLELGSLEILFHSNLPDHLCREIQDANPACVISKQ